MLFLCLQMMPCIGVFQVQEPCNDLVAVKKNTVSKTTVLILKVTTLLHDKVTEKMYIGRSRFFPLMTQQAFYNSTCNRDHSILDSVWCALVFYSAPWGFPPGFPWLFFLSKTNISLYQTKSFFCTVDNLCLWELHQYYWPSPTPQPKVATCHL